MNKENILFLADHIESLPHVSRFEREGFNMSDYSHPCGTPSCLCGWANYFSGNSPISGIRMWDHISAGNWLGITNTVALDELFAPPHDQLKTVYFEEERSPLGLFSQITPQHAANTLRHLAETGEVDWRIYS